MKELLRAEDLLCHLDVLRRAARLLSTGDQDPDDLVQETCVRVLTRPRRVAADHQVAYLLTALRNTARERRRFDRSHPPPVQLHEQLCTCCPDEEALERVALRGLIDELPPSQRAAVVAVDLLGLRYAEAAASLQVPTGTIMSRLCRGRRSLAAAIEGAG